MPQPLKLTNARKPSDNRKIRNRETVEQFEIRMNQWMTRGVEVEPATEDKSAVYREPNCKEMAIIAIFCKRQDDMTPQVVGRPSDDEAEEQLKDMMGMG